MTELHKITDVDCKNSIMFWDGSFDSMTFQQKIQTYQHQYSTKTALKKRSSMTKLIILTQTKHIDQIPDILSLKETVNNISW